MTINEGKYSSLPRNSKNERTYKKVTAKPDSSLLRPRSVKDLQGIWTTYHGNTTKATINFVTDSTALMHNNLQEGYEIKYKTEFKGMKCDFVFQRPTFDNMTGTMLFTSDSTLRISILRRNERTGKLRSTGQRAVFLKK